MGLYQQKHVARTADASVNYQHLTVFEVVT